MLDESKAAIIQPKLGMACVAKCEVNGHWYRGKIVGGMDLFSFVDVAFVDYGNVQSTPICYVKAIDKEFVDLPPQAYKCSLDVPMGSSSGTSEDIHRFISSTMGKRFWAKFTPRGNNPNLTVELTEYRDDGSIISINKLFEQGSKRHYQQVTENNAVFYVNILKFCLILQAFGEGNNAISTASPSLAANGSLLPAIQQSNIKVGPDGNAFSSPVAAPYWTMFPPPPSPLFGNTTTRYAQQPFNTFIASPYVRQANTSVNYLSSGAGPSTSGAVPSKVESVEIVTLSELDLDEPSPRVELSSTESTPGTPHQSTVPDNIGGSNLFTL